MTSTLGQLAFEAYLEFLPSVYIDQHCIPETWQELSHCEKLAWQRAAVAVLKFRASSVKSSDIFYDWSPEIVNPFAPRSADSPLAGAIPLESAHAG